MHTVSENQCGKYALLLQQARTGAVLRDISRNTFQKTSTAMHWMVSSITTPAGR